MHNSNPNFPYRQSKRSSANTLMDSTQQLIDSLTAHISLYHSKSSPPTTNPNPRSSILKWFSSLTVHQRQSHFTTVDPNFVRILLQMQSKLKSNGGHGLFIILPDIPSRAGKFLPSLCYRKSHGLLARASDCNGSEGLIYQSIRLFNSREGERADECSCSVSYLDSVTVSDKFLENVDEFVAVMDAVSNGGFLRGEETGMFDEWVELEWLKAKGYYSIEAFLANKLEVALRLSWLNCNGGKKRGLKLKEKANLAGVAANVFWRKKGCMDWWTRLDDAMRRNVFQTVLGKAAKYLTVEVLNGTNSALDEEMLPFSSGSKQPLECNSTLSCRRTISTLEGAYTELGVRAASNGRTYLLSYVFNKLLVLQEVSAMMVACQRSDYDKDKLFFSSLGTLRTVSDCILRKLRGLLLLIYLDCTKLELLEEGNLKHSPKKSKDKLVAYGRKKKGKTLNLKQPTSVPRPLKDEVAPGTPAKDNEYGLACTDNVDTIRSSSLVDTLYEKDVDRGTLLPALDMERNEGLVYRNESSASRKNRGKSNKLKKSGLNIQVERGRSQRRTMEVSSSCANLHGEVEKNDRNPECLIAGDIAEGDSNGNTKLEPNPMSCNLISRCSGMENTTQGVQGEFVVSPDGCNGTMIQNTSERVTEDVAVHTRLETGANAADCRIPTCIPAMEDSVVICNEDGNSRNFGHLSKADTKSVIPGKRTNDHGTDEEAIPIPVQQCEGIFDTGTINSLGYISYEWPVHLPSFNSHLPAATDRLHLDVGNNWQNHFHQPFLQTAHQVRNPQIENGHGGMLSRPLPMSSDWPPVVRGFRGLTSPMTCNYDSGFISRRQCSFHHGFTAQSMQHGAMTSEDERIYSAEFRDVPDLPNSQEVADEQDNHWISEEEFEVHAVSGVDYNQYFGGGVMYWDPSDHPGINFSRPPSLSSDDSSWAWREADMNRAVDDMVAISSSYSTNGLTSPSGASFCSPFDPLVPPHQALGYVIPGTEVSGKVLHSTSPLTDVVKEENVSGSLASLSGDGEAKTGDTLHYPILRPIIIPNMSRERSQSDFQRSHDRRSPRVPPSRREQPRIKRPPSPVVLCVPRAPCPPPPSPVGDSRKHRGFPTVRSGSSSPRHWGVRGWFHDGVNFEEACVRMDSSEVVWPSWRNKSLSARQLSQPLPGALLQDHLIAISHLARDQEHPDVAFPLQPHDLVSCSARKASISLMHSLLHDEIDSFYKQVAAENLSRKPYINWAVKRVTRSLQVLWPRSRTNIFGSNATGLSLPSSDVDLVVCLPPVRNLEPIKEAGILEGRNGIKETCLQHAARYLANQEWVKNDSLKIVENTAIPVIMLVVEVPHDLVASAASVIQRQETTVVITDEPGNPLETDMVGLEMSASPQSSNLNTDQHQGVSSIRLDISFKSPSHTGLQTTELVKELTEQFPAATPLAMVLKQFLADRSLDQSYSGGLSSYCLILLITRFLQHEHHHGRPINQNFGSLLMDFLYFFGNVFDPRQIRISVQGSGLYINRERGYSIDPIYIDDPLFPTNNVGRNCFRIHQCIKAFADAYSVLENELTCLVNNGDSSTSPPCRLLPKIIPSIRFS